MSWTDIFPVLDEDMLLTYQEGVTEEEKAGFEEWFGTERIARLETQDFKTQDTREEKELAISSTDIRSPIIRHIVSATLFWKHVNEGDPELLVPTREMLEDARLMGLVKRLDPWGSYFELLFTHSAAAMEKHPQVKFRLYLAVDLDLSFQN